ncbi:MAG: YifB family Mg chelatase-like AAA ATPase [Kiritimatiellaeota bacterium]|nr:YifB family Mg chelatase-like AAA ATPase [Kiritimatiellota bacterium]
MLAKTFSTTINGVEANAVEIEINATKRGEQTFVSIVGLPDAAVKESRDRVRSALDSCGFRHPEGATIINLAPADIKKEGTGFDLPIAVGMVAASGQIELAKLARTMMVGELALDGSVRPAKGMIPTGMLAASEREIDALLVPSANVDEAAIAANGLPVYPVANLAEAVAYFNDELAAPPRIRSLDEFADLAETSISRDFADVKGQSLAKRALEVAAAGGHNLMMIGPPGAGKSMLAKRFPGILPPLHVEEALESSKIHSVLGLLPVDKPFLTERPYRAPHHTISDAGLLGGQTIPTPGEISLAHNGVLFLDELPEFKRNVLEVLRQPLENGEVTISRAAGTFTFPARFMLLAAMNPCPCGHYGGGQRACRCSPPQIQRYRSKISGPLLDRIDIHVELSALNESELLGAPSGEPSRDIRARVMTARKIQTARFADLSGVYCNARMESAQLLKYCALDPQSVSYLKQSINELNLSARAYDRILRLARTIADLAGSAKLESEHIFEAVQYRSLDKRLW